MANCFQLIFPMLNGHRDFNFLILCAKNQTKEMEEVENNRHQGNQQKEKSNSHQGNQQEEKSNSHQGNKMVMYNVMEDFPPVTKGVISFNQ